MLAWQKSDFDTVQSFVDYSVGWLDDRGYALTIDTDLSRWTAVIATTSVDAFVNPTFDPAHNRLSAANSFWLDVRAGTETVATCAARVFHTEDYFDLMRALRLWWDHPAPEHGRLRVSPQANTPLIAGAVGHEGGLWVHPQHRKRGLSVILPHLARALCVREWDIDWQTGLTRQAIGECGIARWAYGMRHVELCFDGYFPPTRGRERLYLAYVNRQELIGGLDLDAVAGLLPDAYQQPRHAVPLVKEG